MLRDGNRRAFGRTSGNSPAFFLPLNDLGGGQVNLVPGVAFPGTVGIFTRATSATCWSSTGKLLTVGSGVARSTYTELTGASYMGFLCEEARTNNCIQNRDFTNAAWTATNITPAKDQVGIDGVTNSASSLMATAGNGTIAQTITIAAVNRPFSVYVKRLVGTGNIDLAQDGASFTTQTVANDGAYHRCTLVASQLNPTLTIRLATNTDKIAVDFAMLEDTGGAAATFPLSPIATTTVAVTRNADVLTYPSAGNVGAAGTMYCEGFVPVASSTVTFLNINDGTASNRIELLTSSGSLGYNVVTGSVTQASIVNGVLSTNTVNKMAATWTAADFVQYLNGTPSTHTLSGTVPVLNAIRVGGRGGGVVVVPLNSAIRNTKLWTRVLSAAEVAAM